MAGYNPTRKPTFLWQAVLILLPVLLLAVVGFFSLRQDRLLVQHEAAERAQTLAGNLVALVWGELTAKGQGFESRAFKVDSTGQLVFPPASAPVPDPQSFKSAPLNPRQKDLWLAAQQAEAQAADPERTSTAFRDLLNSAPPEGIAASAHFSLGLLLMKEGNGQAAAVEFQQIVDGYPAAVGES
jgi:TolA-binding protein